ncbi:MAG: bifunctional UDP-N-acetylglucosamine diphosphorylase/glucosamine-1-phosphate N-acetyltransferase GlmU [Candidatus Competibacteraceae bacterium]|nr:bifunctional UDP-N-acetylglucosamine diphosphorylase/glucosamine-1-phosphate N-acetyltransferase GlmU [Candidatus Competibacteraceae bacterium]
MNLSVVILAAGKGKRMVSELPKVLHPVGGKAMVEHVLETAAQLGAQQRVVVYGHGGEQVQAALAGQPVAWAEQAQQLGTGHAVAQALPQVGDDGTVLVLYGDVPLVRPETLIPLVEAAARRELGLLTVVLDDPIGYGRIVRDRVGHVRRIVEEKDASAQERHIREVNTGILAAPAGLLKKWLGNLNNDNVQGEYYLTDIIEMAGQDGIRVEAVAAPQPWEVEGVNNRRQLARLERLFQNRQADELMDRGATLLDPERVEVRGSLTTGKDVTIDVNVVFEGSVTLGDRVSIGPNCVIRNAEIGDDVEILAFSHVDGARVASGCEVGPYARLRPQAELHPKAKVGNFVEIKKAVVGEGSKVNHLTYIGDAEIGRDVNVGAGTITCNYDGANKHKTIIDDGAFIGSNSALVAPVRIGKNATVGAGSAIGREVPDGALGLTRAPQKIVQDWLRPRKKG